jgi:FixJ family two-component response regulator
MGQAKPFTLHSTTAGEHESTCSSAWPGAPIAFVVEDDALMRRSLEDLIESAGWHAEGFASATEFLASPHPFSPSCLVLDAVLPDLNGFDLQERLHTERRDMPIIFITSCGDVPMSVRAMKGGAIDFLTKPFRDEALVGAIRYALERSRAVLRHQAEMAVLGKRYGSLTARECEVMGLVVSGRLNKEIAHDLGITEITVKAHRCRVMRKMKARTLADLINMGIKLGRGSDSLRAFCDGSLPSCGPIAWPMQCP